MILLYKLLPHSTVNDDQHQPNSDERHDPTGRDQPRPVAAGDEGTDEYVSLKEACAMFLSHGRPVTDRTLQRSCKKHHFVCQKVATVDGEKWFALKSSVLNRIAELAEFDRLREQHGDATSRDRSRLVAPETQSTIEPDQERPPTTAAAPLPVSTAQPSQATDPDQVATGRDASGHDVPTETRAGLGERERALYDRLVETYQQQLEELSKDKAHLQTDKEAMLRQLEAKDRQIDRFFTSERDTKTLLGSLQSLVNAIWPGSSKSAERFAPVRDALDSGLDQPGDGERHNLNM